MAHQCLSFLARGVLAEGSIFMRVPLKKGVSLFQQIHTASPLFGREEDEEM